MKNYLILLSFILCFTTTMYSQNPNWKLLGEGIDNQVKLLWQPKKWPEGLQGFVVKRRSDSNGTYSDWQSLHEEMIIPENTLTKDLSNISNDKCLIDSLILKRKSLIESNGLKAINTAEYQENLKNEGFLKILAFMFSFDYDRALLSGFGYMDTDIPPANEYEYGLFLVYNGKVAEHPKETFKWTNGKRDLIDLEMNTHHKIINKTLHVKWQFDPQDYEAKNISGFNLYQKDENRNWQKENQHLILISGDLDYFEQRFSIIGKKFNRSFALAPVSIFNTEGKRKEITITKELLGSTK